MADGDSGLDGISIEAVLLERESLPIPPTGIRHELVMRPHRGDVPTLDDHDDIRAGPDRVHPV
jgi:hypothetical protein